MNSNLFEFKLVCLQKKKRRNRKGEETHSSPTPVSSRGPTLASGPARTPFPPSPLCARPWPFSLRGPAAPLSPARLAHRPTLPHAGPVNPARPAAALARVPAAASADQPGPLASFVSSAAQRPRPIRRDHRRVSLWGTPPQDPRRPLNGPPRPPAPHTKGWRRHQEP